MDTLSNKTALIIGASSGIGKATAIVFAREGATLAIVARREKELNETAATIKQLGGKVEVIVADVMKEDDARRSVEQTLNALGRIDILVNAAGILASGTIETTPLAQWDAMLNVNLRSVFHLMQIALPSLIERKGNIVNVSSVTGLRAFPGVLSYCVSKAGLDQLTRCAALELAPKGVRVNAVNPGVVVTGLHRKSGMDEEVYANFLERSKTTHPIGRVGQPEENRRVNPLPCLAARGMDYRRNIQY
jgi:NAD(P)-dependent dehydrogenase (short-subunit alcohol dehydrogenase family)